MLADPSVGVVIPAFNAERFLGQALDSVLSQTHPVADILVIDDGSSDGTSALATNHSPRVRVERQDNAGIGAARNRGSEMVHGDVLAFLDADDLLTPSSIGCRVELLRQRPEVELVFGQVVRFRQLLDGVPVAIDEPLPAHLPGAMFVRRAALARVGPFPTETHVAEGLDWLLRARELPLTEVTLEEQVVWRRVHGENNSLRHRAQIGEFAHALKASLDRRRAADAALRDGP
ncbi:MAG TPA: glycosyltransferase family A protein [Solirubrobacteraceae bacterium]|jgi:GT2 family glycosyltransferase|nr:glycosyltransferase family A protein [Solirubrobacteraceae bacterium]